MRYIKYILFLTTILFMVSCSNKAKNVEAFHSALNSSDVEAVITAYFNYPDGTNMNDAKSYFTPIFDKVKLNMVQGPYEVLKYKQAKTKWAETALLTTAMKPSKIYVVKYANGAFLYVRLSGKKIQSLVPVLKGNVITGWL